MIITQRPAITFAQYVYRTMEKKTEFFEEQDILDLQKAYSPEKLKDEYEKGKYQDEVSE